MLAVVAPDAAYGCPRCPLAARWPGVATAARVELYERVSGGHGRRGTLLLERTLATLSDDEAAELLEDFELIESTATAAARAQAEAETATEAGRRRLLGTIPKQHAGYSWQR